MNLENSEGRVHQLNQLPTPSHNSADLICEVCHVAFKRKEHQERHRHRHYLTRLFNCPVCHKAFSRRDVLQKHFRTHGGYLPKSNRITCQLACNLCAASKSRCGDSTPCSRCQRKNLDCIRPERTLQKVRQFDAVPYYETDGHSNFGQSPILSASKTLPEESTPQSLVSSGPTTSLNPFEIDSFWPNFPSLDIDDLDGPFFSLDQNLSEEDFGHHLDQSNTQSTPSRGRLSSPPFEFNRFQFPSLTAEDISVMKRENSCHVPQLSQVSYQRLAELVSESRVSTWFTSLDDANLTVVFNSFIQLFFEYFHTELPILHLPTFRTNEESAVLLLAMAAIGCQYTAIQSHDQIATGLQESLRLVILHKVAQDSPSNRDISFARAALLHNISLMFGGLKRGVLNLQYTRNLAITLCRPFIAQQGSIFPRHEGENKDHLTHDVWTSWVREESWRRLVYFLWFTECLYLIFHDLPPILTISELHHNLPSSDSLWSCPDSFSWTATKHKHVQNSDPIQCTGCAICNPRSIMSLFQRQSMDDVSIKSLSNSGHLITMVSLYVEEQQLLRYLDSRMHGRTGITANAGSMEAHSLSKTIFDDEFCLFTPTGCSAAELDPINATTNKINHIIAILRRIPLKMIRRACGWQTSKSETERSRSRVFNWINKTSTSRECLLHAAKLFRKIRDQKIMSYCDSLCFLIASEYIWLYAYLICGNTSGQEVSTTTRPVSSEPIRIDGPLNNESTKLWIENGVGSSVHISGIGLLYGGDAPGRVVQEAIRVLYQDGPWAKVSRDIGANLRQLREGN